MPYAWSARSDITPMRMVYLRAVEASMSRYELRRLEYRFGCPKHYLDSWTPKKRVLTKPKKWDTMTRKFEPVNADFPRTMKPRKRK